MFLLVISAAGNSMGKLSRQMSMYPKYYKDPIISTKCFDKEKEKYNQIPIKATENNVSTDIFFEDHKKKMINYITKGGNKHLAVELLTKCFECIKRTQLERYNLSSNEGDEDVVINAETHLIQAIENSRPVLQLSAVKRGGVMYQVPVPVTQKRSYFLAMKWILEAAREKERKVHLPEKLAWEILNASHGQGRVIKRKNDLHRQCESNRAFAHYRWS